VFGRAGSGDLGLSGLNPLHKEVSHMTGMLRVPRSRGALSGVLLVLLGAWGGLIPFIGPEFHYAYTPNIPWTYTSGRLWLEVLPGAATLLGGLIVFASRIRPVAMLGAWLAALSGGWFAVGDVLSVLWMRGGATAAGAPVGGTVLRVAEQIGLFVGLGVAIVFVAALALGRLAVVGVKEAQLATRDKELSTDANEVPDQVSVPDNAKAPRKIYAPVLASAPGTNTSDQASTADSASTPASASSPDSTSTSGSASTPDGASTPDSTSTSGSASTPDSTSTSGSASTPDGASAPDGASTSGSASTPDGASAPGKPDSPYQVKVAP
jgi:hypothetical protein